MVDGEGLAEGTPEGDGAAERSALAKVPGCCDGAVAPAAAGAVLGGGGRGPEV